MFHSTHTLSSDNIWNVLEQLEEIISIGALKRAQFRTSIGSARITAMPVGIPAPLKDLKHQPSDDYKGLTQQLGSNIAELDAAALSPLTEAIRPTDVQAADGGGQGGRCRTVWVRASNHRGREVYFFIFHPIDIRIGKCVFDGGFSKPSRAGSGFR